MRFGKRTLFLFLNGTILAGLLLYFSLWLLSPRVTGRIQRPLHTTRLLVRYTAKGSEYQAELMRNEIPLGQNVVSLRILFFDPGSARVSSFMGLAAEPLAWWLVFLLASGGLLLTHNAVFTRGTVFEVGRKFPWISMEEYLPYQAPFSSSERPPPSHGVKRPGRLDQ